MTGDVLLVRHTQVARAWRGRCYGLSDVPLSREGAAVLGPLAAELAERRPDWVVHSGLLRTRRLAGRVASLAGCPLIEDPDWRERNFGDWEGRSWHAIYRATGTAMDGMIDAPDTFRPGGGETTSELAERANRAWSRLPVGLGVVVTHGGPIAALLGKRNRMSVRDWLKLVPPVGGTAALPMPRQH
jgi:broad specificity phosphatase PhoE